MAMKFNAYFFKCWLTLIQKIQIGNPHLIYGTFSALLFIQLLCFS